MKKEIKKVALFDPYLNTLGGGEKYILSILKVLNDEGYEITIFWDKNLSVEIKNRLSLNFNQLKFLPNIFKNKSFSLSTLKTFDLFFYITNGSYFFSGAKKNFIYAMVPQKSLYNMNFINRLKTWNYSFISHSKFTQAHLQKWNIKSEVIYPYIDTPQIIKSFGSAQDKVILTVGRFFKHLHTKRQDLAIKFFNNLQQTPKFKDYKLILVGGLKKEDQKYYNELIKLAGNNPSIIFKPNTSHSELYKLYEISTFFWHFTGFGINEEKSPELVEHLGITPLEAMSHRIIPFCYAAGGPKELINDGKNGFLFNNEKELTEKMLKIVNDKTLQNKIRTNGIQFIKDNFSYKIFRNRILKIL